MGRQELPLDVFILGMATLERFFHRKLHQGDRDVYYDAVKETTREKWEKVVQYACQRAKTKSIPMPGELREWMGLGELLTPSEEVQGITKGTVFGMTPQEYALRVRKGEDLPLPTRWEHELEAACYLEVVLNDPPPPGAISDAQARAWIRKYAEQAGADWDAWKQKAEATK